MCSMFLTFIFIESFTQINNLVPCPGFECAEYKHQLNDYCEQNNPCCSEFLYLNWVPALEGELNKNVRKYGGDEFWCGPWKSDNSGGEFNSTPNSTPILLSKSINHLYANEPIFNQDAKHWPASHQDDAPANCDIGILYDNCVNSFYACPSEFGIPQNTFGIKEPYPNYIDNNNYVGLRSSDPNFRSGVKVKLTEKLETCVYYIFECDVVKMKDNNTEIKVRFTINGEWGEDNSTKLSEIEIASEWTHIRYLFKAENEAEWIHIKLAGADFLIGTKTLLIDNINLHKICDEDIYACNSNTVISNPNVYCNNIHGNNAPLTFYNLDNFNQVKLEIFNNSNPPQIVFEREYTNPQNTISWNGKTSGGDEITPSIYRYNLVISAGPCYASECSIFEGEFIKGDNFNGSLLISHVTNPDAFTINGLETATLLKIKVKNNQNQVIREIEIGNPRSSISWDNKDNNGLIVEDGIYNVEVYASNKCTNKTINFVFEKSGNLIYSPNFNYSPIPKFTSITNCGYITEPNTNYFEPPAPCCPLQPNIYLSNIVIDGNVSIVALGTITIGPNVFISDGSNVLFLSEIAVITDQYFPELNATSGAEWEVIIDNVCPDLRISSESTEEIYSFQNISNNKGEVEHNNSLLGYPNPCSKNYFLQMEDKVLQSIKVIDVLGKEVNVTIKLKDSLLELDISNLSNGVYFISTKTKRNDYLNKFIKQ